jgi:hypothetical protein
MRVDPRCVIVAAATLSFGGALQAEGLNTRAIISYQQNDYGMFTSRGVRQIYDVRLNRTLAEALGMRLFLRAEDFRGRTELETEDAASRSIKLQPTGELTYERDAFHAGVKYDYQRMRSETGELESVRNLSQALTTLNWTPAHGPLFSLYGERRTSADQATSLDRIDDAAGATAQYAIAGLRVVASERYANNEDQRAGYVRTSLDHQVQLTYDKTYFDGKLTTVADVVASDGHTDERARRGGAVRISNPVLITRALYAVDDTPLDGRDHPLTALQTLVDGDLNRSTGLALGPDGASFLNVALDLQRVAEVDEIRVVVRDASGNPARVGGGVRWDVYTSDDGERWVLLGASAQTVFDAALSQYFIDFPLTNTRWIKVVTFGVSVEPAYVTEILAYYHTVIENRRDVETSSRRYYGNANIIARPVRWATVGYYGLFNDNANERGGTELRTRDADHVGSIRFDPWRVLSFEARYETRTVQALEETTQSYDGWTGLLRFTPTRAVDATLQVTRRDENNQGLLSESLRTELHLFARVIPSVDVTLDVGTQEQNLLTEGYTVKRRYLSTIARAELYPGVRVIATGTMQRGDREAVIPLPGFVGIRDDRFTADLQWRPGRPLTVTARIGRAVNDERSAWIQQYRLEWYPFADGTLSIGGTWDQDIDPWLDRTSTRLIVSPRWAINSHATFDLNYTAVDATGSMASELSTFFATLTLTR